MCILREAVCLRVSNIPNLVLTACEAGAPYEPHQNPAKLAILFSGGLDCTLLARIAHETASISDPIDLLNVACQNPRIHGEGKALHGISPYELCPDRITARNSLLELQRVCVGRVWRLVEINVPYEEMLEHRENILNLMYPHNTEMDLSIASALYFAARGAGIVRDSPSSSPSRVVISDALLEAITYVTPARVLLSGLGADELFGGYQRHATAFARRSLSGLLAELAIDIERLGKRNLGRDDRVTSHFGREVRYPYLDDNIVTWAMERPVWEKCGFGEHSPTDPCSGDRSGSNLPQSAPPLDPGKKILRLLACELGMYGVAREGKRAVSIRAPP